MRCGYTYQHVSAKDIYIEVIGRYPTGTESLGIRCRIFNAWIGAFYGNAFFTVHHNDLWKWEFYQPCPK